jgi:Na+/H+ antiporter NhaD/arsenite permease-like protein
LASVSESPGRPAARVVTAVIVAIIALVLVILGVIYLAEPSKSLPSMIPGHLAASMPDASKNHPLRGAGCLVLGVIFFGAAWFALSFQPKAPTSAASRPNSPAGRH